jgi:hypothetical protein
MRNPSTKVIVDLGSEKRRNLLEEFARKKGITLQDMMLLALREWLERQEEEEDIQAIKEVENEPTKPIEKLLAEMASDKDEMKWLRAAASNPAFDFLRRSNEDIYTLADGKPFNG